MDLNCTYHSDQPAAWACDGCQKDFCSTCVPAGSSTHWGVQGPKCALCNRSLTYLGEAGGAKPFWQMVPHFMAYPLQARVLCLIALGGLAVNFIGMGLFTVFLGLFFAAVVVKYGFAIIEERGKGNASAPGVGAVIQGDQDHLFLKQVGVFIFMGVATAYAYRAGEVLGLLASIFVALALPASTIILAVDKSLRRALNPLALVSMMAIIGLPYILLWFCVQLISSGPYYAIDILAGVLPESLLFPVLAALSLYFAFVTYCMLGYVLFQYQHELGYVNRTHHKEEIGSRDFLKARALAETSILFHEGDYDRARTQLRHALDQVPDDISLHDRYHKLLMVLEDQEALKNHTCYFIDLLIRFGQKGKAASIYLDGVKKLPNLQLDNIEQACIVADMLLMQGNAKAVLKLLHNIHKQHGKNPEVVRAYLLVARAYNEYLGLDAKAKQVLTFLQKHYPNTQHSPSVEQFLSQLETV